MAVQKTPARISFLVVSHEFAKIRWDLAWDLLGLNNSYCRFIIKHEELISDKIARNIPHRFWNLALIFNFWWLWTTCKYSKSLIHTILLSRKLIQNSEIAELSTGTLMK